MQHFMKRVNKEAELLAEQSSDVLFTGIVNDLVITAEKLVSIAARVKVLDSRGFEWNDRQLPMINWFRRIADGAILPEVFERFQYKPDILKAVSSLPIAEQSKLVSENSRIEVLVVGDDGPSTLKVDPREMSTAQKKQVFSGGKLRTLAEQRGYLEQRDSPRRRAVQELETGIMIDRRKRGIVVNGVFVSRSQLLSYLSHFDD